MSSDLWSFSVSTYSRPGVEPACLHLQSTGVNVCLLLCGLWLGERGVTCTEQRLRQLREIADPWDANVVQPLRAVRSRWKAAAGQDPELSELREEVKALEMQAERHLLKRLERTALSWPHSEATDVLAWLESVAAGAVNLDHDALLQLRVAATGT